LNDLSRTLDIGNFIVYLILTDHSGNFWIAINTGSYKYHSGKRSLKDKNLLERYSIIWLAKQHIIIANPAEI